MCGIWHVEICGYVCVVNGVCGVFVVCVVNGVWEYVCVCMCGEWCVCVCILRVLWCMCMW